MVGLVDKGESILGVVYKPVDDKMYFAEKGNGAYLKEAGRPRKRLKVSGVSNLSEAKFVFSNFYLSRLEKRFIKASKIAQATYMGSIGVKLGLIAEGKADGYLTTNNRTSQWDICAPEIILKEAGGKVTDLKDESFIYNRRQARNSNGIIASNGKIHTSIIKNVSHIKKEE